MTRRAFSLQLLILALFTVTLSSIDAFAQSPQPTDHTKGLATQIWFAPLDPVFRPRFGDRSSNDFMKMFEPGAAWPRGRSYVEVFKLYPQFLAKASDTDLSVVINYLKREHIALGTDFGLLLARRETECGWGVEGYNGTGAANVSARITRLGGTLAYVVADEPLFFGHDFIGPNTCHADITELARQAAQTANVFRSFFPNVKIAEAEPIDNF